MHGLGYSPDSGTLAVVSVGSNSVTLIDAATNRVKAKVYLGRSPHEAFFTPDAKELWVTVRGEDYVSVIDPIEMKETGRIKVANGPGMTMFGPDGHYAFVCSSFTPELAVIDPKSHQIIKRLSQASAFCPNIAVSPENDEVWITLKDLGKVQVFSASPPFAQKWTLDTGPITNHVNFANNRNGKFAYCCGEFARSLGSSSDCRRGTCSKHTVSGLSGGVRPFAFWKTRIPCSLEDES
ncbi:MAG TPA: YncE family protein [Pyrinomonadaceae bacterium]|nr:YncE family protein [Pyrinomonadaceae bacterium]